MFNGFDPLRRSIDPRDWSWLSLPKWRDRLISTLTGSVRGSVEQGDVSTAADQLLGLHPADQAQVLRELPKAVESVVTQEVSVSDLARIFDEAGHSDALGIAQALDLARLAEVVEASRPESSACVLRSLGPDARQAVLETVSVPTADAINALLGYQEGTAGALFAPGFPTLAPNAPVGDALRSLRDAQRTPPYRFDRVYVVGEDRRVAGFVPVLDLALARDTTLVSELMAPAPIHVNPTTPLSEVAATLSHYNLSQISVLSEEGEYLGAIPQDYTATLVVEAAMTEAQHIGSVGTGDSLTGSVANSIRNRLPWLMINLGTTFLAAAAIGLFDSTIAKLVILAAFLPVVAGQGGIGGTQTMTLMVRGIALGELAGVSAGRLLRREVFIGVFHGLVLGIAVAFIALAWQRNAGLAVVLGFAMWGNMIIAGVVGAGIPLLLYRLRQDPAVSAAIIITTFTDVLGFTLFLGLAGLAIAWLV